jgi:hypothetical protein
MDLCSVPGRTYGLASLSNAGFGSMLACVGLAEKDLGRDATQQAVRHDCRSLDLEYLQFRCPGGSHRNAETTPTGTGRASVG